MSSALDAIRSLRYINVCSKDEFYHALKANLVIRPEDAETFDRAFRFFWSLAGNNFETCDSCDALGQDQAASDQDQEVRSSSSQEEGSAANGGSQGLTMFLAEEAIEGADEKAENEGSNPEVVGYSPYEALFVKDLGFLTEEEAAKVHTIITSLFPKITLLYRTRRHEPSIKGKTWDLRRTLRKSLRTGGEMLSLAKKKSKLERVRLVLLCDVSGSMDAYSKFFLELMHALKRKYRRTEVFVFSTRLVRITRLLSKLGIQEALSSIPSCVPGWAGGTDIGGSLKQFNEGPGRYLLSKHTTTVILSDGWDRGDAEVLSREIKLLSKRSGLLIWLNPLLGQPGYEPLCTGIRVSLPHIDAMLPAHNLQSLLGFVRLIGRANLAAALRKSGTLRPANKQDIVGRRG